MLAAIAMRLLSSVVGSSHSRLPFWARIALPTVVASLSLIVVIVTIRAGIIDQRDAALGVNIAGRQRMLNQRVHKETLQFLHGQNTDSNATLALLEKSALALRDGGEFPLGKEKVGVLRPNKSSNEVELLDRQIVLIDEVRRVVTALRASTPSDQAIGEFEALTADCHRAANDLVLAMQGRSEADLQGIVQRSLLLTLLALGLSAALTYRMSTFMASSFSEVSSAARSLADGDLRVDLHGRSDDVIGRMASDLGDAIDSIRLSIGTDEVHWEEFAAEREADVIVQAAMLEQAPGGIVRASTDGVIQYANAAALDLLNRSRLIGSPSIPEGETLAGLFHGVEIPSSVLAGERTDGQTFPLKTSRTHIDLQALPILDSGNVSLGTLVTLEDTTERAKRATEAQEAAERERSERAMLSESVEQILKVVAAASSGDLRARTGRSGDDPIDQVGMKVDSLLESFEQNMRALFDQIDAMRSAAHTMGESSTTLKRSADETADQARAAFEASESTADSARATSAGITQVTQSIDDIAKNANTAAMIAADAVVAASESTQLVQSLDARSQEIDDVVKVITSIASQTNLLALNATIEAARAGELGKGFAVVAGEVKGLATETSQATHQIGERISGIKNDIAEAIQSISRIESVIQRINETQASIAATVEEQSVTAREMSKEVRGVADGTDVVRNALSAMTTQAQLTGQGSQQSKETAKQIASMSDKIEDIVSHYAVSR